MKPPIRALTLRSVALPLWVRRMFNLNDSRWGRDDDKPAEPGKAEGSAPEGESNRPVVNNNDPMPGRKGQPTLGRQIWMNCGRTLIASSVACSENLPNCLQVARVVGSSLT